MNLLRTSAAFGGLLTLIGAIFLAVVVWKGDLSPQSAIFVFIWLAIGIGLLLWGLRQTRNLSRDRRNYELMSLIYAVVGIPVMLAAAAALGFGYLFLAVDTNGPANSMTPFEMLGSLS